MLRGMQSFNHLRPLTPSVSDILLPTKVSDSLACLCNVSYSLGRNAAAACEHSDETCESAPWAHFMDLYNGVVKEANARAIYLTLS